MANSSRTAHGQLGRRPGQLPGPPGQPVLGQYHRGRPEGVGLDHVAAHLEEGAVQLRDEVGTGLDEHLVAALEVGPAEVVRPEAEQLQAGAHGAVEDHHALAQRLKVGGGGRVEPAQEFG